MAPEVPEAVIEIMPEVMPELTPIAIAMVVPIGEGSAGGSHEKEPTEQRGDERAS